MPSIRSGVAAAAFAVAISTFAAGPAAARSSVGVFVGAGPPVYFVPPPRWYYAPPPPPPPVYYAPPVPRFYYAPPPAYRYWPY